MEYGSVIFDMDGVVLDYEAENFDWIYEVVKEVLQDKGVETEDLSRSDFDAFLGEKGVKECIDICNKYGLDARTVWSELADSTTEARAKQIKKGNFDLFSDSMDVIEELHEAGIEMALVSNAPESAVELTLENYNLSHFFEYYRGISDFDDLSDRKPRPDHLNYAEAELKKGPFIFIGDSASDIIAAQNANMESVWLNRDNSSIDIRPDHEIKNLTELLELIGVR